MPQPPHIAPPSAWVVQVHLGGAVTTLRGSIFLIVPVVPWARGQKYCYWWQQRMAPGRVLSAAPGLVPPLMPSFYATLLVFIADRCSPAVPNIVMALFHCLLCVPATLEQRLTRDDLRGSALKQVPQVLLVPIVVLLQETCQGRCKKEYKEASTSANNEATKCEPKGKNIKTA